MKLIRSFSYAWQGIHHCFVHEQNFRIHCCISAVVFVAASLLHCTAVEWLVLLICMALVFVLEMLNTALERLCDLQQKTYHPVVKIVKDVAAGAVLIAAIFSGIAGIIIFFPKLISIF